MSTTTFTQEGYSQKARGTHARVSRVKVTPVPRAGKTGSPLAFEKPSTASSTPTGSTLTKNCVRCKESANCVKTLQTKLGKIEQLVRNLETSTTKYTDEKPPMHQQQQQQQQQQQAAPQPPLPPQPQPLQLQLHHPHHHQPSPPLHHRQLPRHARLSRKHPVMRPPHRGIDLSKLTFTEFQKLVAVTTNTPFPVAPPTNTIITKLSTTEPMIDVKPTPAIHSDPQHYHISGGGGNTKSDPDDSELPSSPSTISSQLTSTSTNVGHKSPPVTAAMALRQNPLRKDSGYTSDSESSISRKHTLSSGLSQGESTIH